MWKISPSSFLSCNPLVDLLKNFHMVPPLPHVHIHLLSSDWKRHLWSPKYIFFRVFVCAFHPLIYLLLVRVFPLFSNLLCYPRFGTFLSTWFSYINNEEVSVKILDSCRKNSTWQMRLLNLIEAFINQENAHLHILETALQAQYLSADKSVHKADISVNCIPFEALSPVSRWESLISREKFSPGPGFESRSPALCPDALTNWAKLEFFSY